MQTHLGLERTVIIAEDFLAPILAVYTDLIGLPKSLGGRMLQNQNTRLTQIAPDQATSCGASQKDDLPICIQ